MPGIYRSLVRPALPAAAHRALQPMHRNYIFRRGIKRLLKDPQACTDPNHPAIQDFIYGWAGTWCAREEYLAGCIRHVLNTDGPILECGSGMSTIVIGALAKLRGRAHWALEHMPTWGQKVSRLVRKFRLNNVRVYVKPLKDYGAFEWYDAPLVAMPDRFGMVVCDGPPAGIKGGRYGLVPVMGQRLAQECVILLDDAERELERSIARRWGRELSADVQVHGSEKPYIEMTVASS